MFRRLFVTALLLLLAFAAFCGFAGPAPGGLFNPFGFLFLGLACASWHLWDTVGASLSREKLGGAFGALVGRGFVGGFDRAADDHYRRDGEENYREDEERRR